MPFWLTLNLYSADRKMWAEMKMSPTDLADVSGYTYTYLMNGQAPDGNWTGIFKPGEKIRLRFIKHAAHAAVVHAHVTHGNQWARVRAWYRCTQPFLYRKGAARIGDFIDDERHPCSPAG